jgi:hypothetical protein
MEVTYDNAFGGLLVATWFNALLYTLEVNQVQRYFRKYSNHDPFLIRAMVVICVGVDGANLIVQCACVYLYAVTHWGDEPYLRRRSWTIPTFLITTSLTAFVVQSFLIRRFHRLAKKPIITAALAVLSLGAIGGALSCAAIIFFHDDYIYRERIITPAIIWLSLSAGTDCAIAGTLVMQLHKMKSGFKGSEGMIRRITVTAIQTGTVTSVLALTALGTFLGFVDTNISTSFGFCLGCFYTLTMLHNLNQRRSISGSDSTIGSTLSAHTGYRVEPGSLGLNITRLTDELSEPGTVATDRRTQSTARVESNLTKPESRTPCQDSTHGKNIKRPDVNVAVPFPLPKAKTKDSLGDGCS